MFPLKKLNDEIHTHVMFINTRIRKNSCSIRLKPKAYEDLHLPPGAERRGAVLKTIQFFNNHQSLDPYNSKTEIFRVKSIQIKIA